MPGGRGGVAAKTWFEDTFGFQEGSYAETRSKFDFADGSLQSKANSKSFFVGPFEVLSLDELRGRVKASASAGGSAAELLGGLTFKNVVGDARALHRDAANAGAVFQVASQFNCLEMVGPDVRPEDGVTRYYCDATQGPACALACPAGTVFRNYFVHGTKGQGGGHQVDCLAPVGELVGNEKQNYWRMANGYCMPHSAGSIAKLSNRLKDDAELAQAARSRLQVGIHWDTEVAGSSHRVCQVFSSALPVAYAKSTRSADWEPFACAVLDATFSATLAAAAVLAAERAGRVKVYLTMVGGGAFGNRSMWILNALEGALREFAGAPLDVMMVNFGTLPRGELADLEKKWKKDRGKLRAPSPAPRSSKSREPSPAPGTGAKGAADRSLLSRIDVRPYGVLGTQVTKEKKLRKTGEEPGSDTAVTDPAGLDFILKWGPGRAGGAGGASRSIYDWLGLDAEEAFPERVRDAITAPLRAKFHTHQTDRGSRTCIHVVGPNFSEEPAGCSQEQAVDMLSQAYQAVLAEFAASRLSCLRMPPLSGGLFAGRFREEMPRLTWLALQLGFGRLTEEQQGQVLRARSLEMCIFFEQELQDFSDAHSSM